MYCDRWKFKILAYLKYFKSAGFFHYMLASLITKHLLLRFPFLESPSLSNIENSMGFLKEQGALTSEEELTMIGRMLAQLPVDVVMGKMLIMGTIFNVWRAHDNVTWWLC